MKKFILMFVLVGISSSLLANDCLSNYKLRLKYREKKYKNSKDVRERDKWYWAAVQYNDLNAVLSNDEKYLVKRMNAICEQNYGIGKGRTRTSNLAAHCYNVLHEANRNKKNRGGKNLFEWIKARYNNMFYCQKKSRMPSITKKYKQYSYNFNFQQEYLDHYRED